MVVTCPSEGTIDQRKAPVVSSMAKVDPHTEEAHQYEPATDPCEEIIYQYL